MEKTGTIISFFFSFRALQKDGGNLSQERVLKVLVNLGLSETEAEVYVFLATEGPQEYPNIAEALNMEKHQLYHSVKSLKSKGLLSVMLQSSSQFSALPFEKALDLLIKAHWKKVKRIEYNKEEILTQWHAIIDGKS